jgi:energy-coupling factor transporter transmembrane protein EcfT
MTIKQVHSGLANTENPRPALGSLGRLVIFLWALGMVMLPPLEKGVIPALIVLAALGMLYPLSLRQMIRPRWLMLLAGLFLVNLFFGIPEDGADFVVLGLQLSSVAAVNGLQMVLRAAVVLIAVDGLSSSVDITEVAGLFERGGLRGLGFSIGVATNLLPELRQSSINAWHSLRMRGGLRARWWRGIQLMVLTVLTNALRHTESIVLAAEARAYRPELSRRVPLRIGLLDGWVMGICFVSIILVMVIT